MSVSYAYGKHAFYNVDSLVDVLVSVGMRPIFELSFMPDWLTSGNHTVCHYKGNSDPPSNYRCMTLRNLCMHVHPPPSIAASGAS